MSKQALIEQDDRWYRGETKSLTFDVVDSEGDPVTMTSWSLAWVMQELHDGATDVLSKITGDGVTIGDGAGTDDRATVAIAAADTEDLEPRVYRQALWRTDGASPQLLAEGAVMLQAGAELDEVSS